MGYRAEINVMPHKELLDPQGKAVAASMKNLELPEIHDVRVGKHISLLIDADTEEEAKLKVETACRKLLVNPIMEKYEFQLFNADEHR